MGEARGFFDGEVDGADEGEGEDAGGEGVGEGFDEVVLALAGGLEDEGFEGFGVYGVGAYA